MHRCPARLFRWVLVGSLSWLCASSADAGSEQTPFDAARIRASDPHRILLHAADFDTREGSPASPGGLEGDRATGQDYLLFQFDRPIDRAIRQRVELAGGTIHGYIPNRALLVKIDEAGEGVLRAANSVQWAGLYEPAYRLSPTLGKRSFKDPLRAADPYLWLTLDLFEGESIDQVAQRVGELGAALMHVDTRSFVRRLHVRARPELVDEFARIKAVRWIEEWPEMTSRNDSNAWIAQSNVENVTPLWDRGLFGEGQIIGHIDRRLEHDSCFFADPVDNTPGPDHRKVVAYRSDTGFGSDLHGTHTAATLAGDQEPVNGSTMDNGIAYKARISHSNRSDIDGFGSTTSNLAEYLTFAHDDGARVHTNSWGDDENAIYSTWCEDIDIFSRMFEDDLVGFAVTNEDTLRSPENAKNCLAVGASFDSPSQDLHSSGGTGPTLDGRRKPEIFAPGLGTVSSSTGACATTFLNGTSMACPVVMGSAALVREYYESGWYPRGVEVPEDGFIPTGALVKATLLNATVDMDPPGYPSDLEGWGRLLLEDALYFHEDERKLQVWDVRHAEGLATGDSLEFVVGTTPSFEKIRFTLAFMDEAASPSAEITPVNDLDLEVSTEFATYWGNDIENGISLPNGVGDPLNNVEMVILNSLGSTEYTVRVHANQVVGDPQGFALVISGSLDLEIAGAGGSASNGHLGTPVHLLPNPFSPETTVQFQLLDPGEVFVSVFDTQGRQVRSLFEGRLYAGQHRIVWDGTSDSGLAVASGVYMVRLRQDGRVIGSRSARLIR